MAYNYEKERREAIDAGNKALDSLYAARNSLNSAKNWGIFDILGGGFVTDLIKHSKMNTAQKYMEQAKYDLESFGKELKDVSENIDMNFNTGDLLSFADFFFDNMFTDLLMQNRINDAREKIDFTISKVERILNTI